MPRLHGKGKAKESERPWNVNFDFWTEYHEDTSSWKYYINEGHHHDTKGKRKGKLISAEHLISKLFSLIQKSKDDNNLLHVLNDELQQKVLQCEEKNKEMSEELERLRYFQASFLATIGHETNACKLRSDIPNQRLVPFNIFKQRLLLDNQLNVNESKSFS